MIVNSVEPADFDEKLFNDLRSKHNVMEEVADLVPQREEKPDKESVDPGTAIDDFMNSWQNKIDTEIMRMKVEIAEMGAEFNAVS